MQTKTHTTPSAPWLCNRCIAPPHPYPCHQCTMKSHFEDLTGHRTLIAKTLDDSRSVRIKLRLLGSNIKPWRSSTKDRRLGKQFSTFSFFSSVTPQQKPRFVSSPWISLCDKAIRSKLILLRLILRIHQNLLKTRTHDKYGLISLLDLSEQTAEARELALGAADVLFQLRRPLD